MSVYCSHDGAYINDHNDHNNDHSKDSDVDNGRTCTSTLHTDWICLQVQEFVHADPFASYMHLTGLYNKVYKLLRLDQLPFQHTISHLAAVEECELRKWRQTDINDNDDNSNDNNSNDNNNDSNHGGGVVGRLPVGWCSWYHYYDHIDEKSLNQVMMQTCT